MKNTSKILALVLVLMTVLVGVSAFTVSAEGDPLTHTFDCTTIEFTADKATVSGAYDDYFTFTGKVTMRGSAEKGVTSVEIEKKSQGSIDFTTKNKATVTIYFSSTGGSNLSVLDFVNSEGISLGTAVQEVTGTTFITAKYEIATAGTYRVVNPGTDRTTRIQKIEVVEVPLGNVEDCEHEYADATCTAPATCSKCGDKQGEALGHNPVPVAEVPATCMTDGTEAGTSCSRCEAKITGQEEIEATGHKYVFTATQPTATSAGRITGVCSVEGCGATFDSGEFNVMTPGEYVLDAAAFDGIATKTLSDGYVKVVDGVFAAHLSYKYRTDADRSKDDSFTALGGWVATHRMNLQGVSALLEGGYKNYIQIVTTGETTITVAWGNNKANRQIAIYNMDGTLADVSFGDNPTQKNPTTDNSLAVSEFTVPAGAYLIGTYMPEGVTGGGLYFHKVIVDVACDEHDFTDATCTEAPKCTICGEEVGEALGHTWVDATCTAPKTCSVCNTTEGEALAHEYVDGKCACGAEDPDYVAPVDPQPEPQPEPELNFFQKIIAWFTELINKILAIFKK